MLFLVRVKGLARLRTGGGAEKCPTGTFLNTRPSSPFPLSKKKVTAAKAAMTFLVRVKGLDSRGLDARLVAGGRNSPPDCFSVPPLFESFH